ncbi:hypothetical protein ACVRZR_05520 [Streptococcus entericus]|uniref:hypothetical protein n=1 Tax=Streptococcus entericus TaxID=155680 RepID=UPI000372C731|nr:hypothetical protein [Streptococcus entericus]
MPKIFSRLTFMLIALCFLFLPLSVSAQEQTGTVIIQPTYDAKPILGGDIVVYQIASVSSDNPRSYELLPTYQSAPISLEATQLSDNSANYAQILTSYVEKDTPVVKATIDSNEGLVVPQLAQGVYLFVQETPADGYELLKPFLITIPKDGQYTINAIEKMSPIVSKQKTVTPSPTLKRTQVLPYTGQVWWPVYLLNVLGVVLIGISFMKRGQS